MDTWWNSLDTALRIFYAMGVGSAAILALQLMLMVVGMDAHHDLDADVHDSGLGFLSVRTVTSFFAGFSWAGIVALEAGWGLPAAVLVAVLAGGTLMTTVVFLMRGLYSLRSSGTLDYRNALDAIGTVYLPVPPSMERPGQVEVIVQGRLCVVSAFTRAEHTLPNRSRVRVTEVVGTDALVVEPLEIAAGSVESKSEKT